MIHEPSLALTDRYGLAQRFGLSAYDASYLALALELRLPLACTDNQLRAALESVGVRLA